MNQREKFESKEELLRESISKKDGVIAAYVFGSVAKGKETKLSDIDFAFYLEDSLGKDRVSELKFELINEISSILGTDELDVVIMNNAPITLNYNALRSGRLMASTDETKRVMFEAKTMSEYLDRKYYIERHAEKAIERINKRGLT